MVSKKLPTSPDECELHFMQLLSSKKEAQKPYKVALGAFDAVRAQVNKCDISSTAAIRSHISPWWRVLGTTLEGALSVTSLNDSGALFEAITDGFQGLRADLDALIERAGFGPFARDTLTIYSGFNIAYTGAVRAGLESMHAVADPVLACDLLLGLEACLALDNKGNSNIYKKVRQEDDEQLRHVLLQHPAGSPMEGFDDGDVVLEDGMKAFDRFWTMMDVSRRNDPELLTDTKSWGKFSQSATATLNLLLDQPDGFEAPSKITAEPCEYEAEAKGFPIQLSSGSFRRRAILNILFACSYVSLNSTNALISAAARSLFNSALKSLPEKFHAAISMLLKMEAHWGSWKSANNFTKESCGPVERKSRLERGLDPFGENVLDLTAIPSVEGPETVTDPHRVVGIISSGLELDQQQGSKNVSGVSYRESLKEKMDEFRKYVSEAILCDISDETQVARLSASDEGIEEALRMNNDRVLLWQFKRMRFSTDLKSFSKQKTTTATDPIPPA